MKRGPEALRAILHLTRRCLDQLWSHSPLLFPPPFLPPVLTCSFPSPPFSRFQHVEEVAALQAAAAASESARRDVEQRLNELQRSSQAKIAALEGEVRHLNAFLEGEVAKARDLASLEARGRAAHKWGEGGEGRGGRGGGEKARCVEMIASCPLFPRCLLEDTGRRAAFGTFAVPDCLSSLHPGEGEREEVRGGEKRGVSGARGGGEGASQTL